MRESSSPWCVRASDPFRPLNCTTPVPSPRRSIPIRGWYRRDRAYQTSVPGRGILWPRYQRRRRSLALASRSSDPIREFRIMAAIGHYEHMVHIGYRARAVGNDDANATPRTDAKNSFVSACSPSASRFELGSSSTIRNGSPYRARASAIRWRNHPAASSYQMRAWRWVHTLVLRNIKSLSCETASGSSVGVPTLCLNVGRQGRPRADLWSRD
jgi:hypothetical protein